MGQGRRKDVTVSLASVLTKVGAAGIDTELGMIGAFRKPSRPSIAGRRLDPGASGSGPPASSPGGALRRKARRSGRHGE
jgi:hypothetical protein